MNQIKPSFDTGLVITFIREIREKVRVVKTGVDIQASHRSVTNLLLPEDT